MRMFAVRQVDYRVTAVVLVCCIALGWLAEHQLLGGGARSLVLAAAMVSIPLLALFSWRQPLLFPFCAYVALVPFDNLLASGNGETLTKVLAIVTCVALILHLVLARNAIGPSRSVFAWLALLIWMAVSIFWSIDQNGSIERYPTYFELFLLLAVVASYPAKLFDVQAAMYSAIAGACAASLYGLYLFVNGNGDYGSRMYLTGSDSHVDPNHFGASLLMPIALSMMLALRTKGWLKPFACVPIVILMAGLYAAESRGAFTATGFILSFIVLFSRYRVQSIIGTILAIIALPATFIQRMQVAAASGGNGRTEIWSSGLEALKHYWMLGAGIGSFPSAYDSVFLKVHHSIFFSWHIQAHNLIVQTAVELGVLGLVLMLGAWLFQFRDARRLGAHEGYEDIAVALQAGVLGLFVSSIFLDIMWSKYTWLAFILVALTRSAIITQNRIRKSTV